MDAKRTWQAARAALAAAALAGGAAGCATAPPPSDAPAAGLAGEEHLLLLRGQGLVVGLLPDAGGRVVVCRAEEGRNLLLADPAQWAGPHPEPAPGTPWKAYQGHTVWVGPQQDWWVQQDLDPQRKARAAQWPPDPYLEYARAQVVARTATSAVLRLPPSPVSGVALTKEVALVAPRVVRLKVTAENRRDRPVAWDLWSNTRVPGDAAVYLAPPAAGRPLKVEFQTWEPARQRPLLYRIVGDWIAPDHLDPLPPPASHRTGKLFVGASRGVLAAFQGRHLLVKRATAPDLAGLHPAQAFLEVWSGRGAPPDRGMLELEMHGPYRTLAPGETMAFEETWQVLDYGGRKTPSAHAAFLDACPPPP